MTVHVKQDFDQGRNFNMEQRAVIKFNAKLGKSAETFRSMQQVYGSQCLGRTAVFEWHKRFLEGRERPLKMTKNQDGQFWFKHPK